MLTPEEKRAVLFLAAVAAAGGLVRVVRAPRPAPAAVVAPELRGDDVQRQAALARREADMLRLLAADERVDLDRASAREIERLPGVGPSLARRIVADREANGAFGSLDGLDQVPGVGPAMIAAIRPHAEFSGPPRQPAEPQAAPRVGASRRNTVRPRSTRSSAP